MGKLGRNIPGCLSKIWALPGSLEERPLLQVEFLWYGVIGQASALVVCLNEVGDNGTALKKRDIVVRVNNC